MFAPDHRPATDWLRAEEINRLERMFLLGPSTQAAPPYFNSAAEARLYLQQQVLDYKWQALMERWRKIAGDLEGF